LPTSTTPTPGAPIENDVGAFIRFAAIERAEDLRLVTRAHVLQWRKSLEARMLAGEHPAQALGAVGII